VSPSKSFTALRYFSATIGVFVIDAKSLEVNKTIYSLPEQISIQLVEYRYVSLSSLSAVLSAPTLLPLVRKLDTQGCGSRAI